MLRKQTIWLLTMLSLVVVLSVYYVTAEPTSQTASNLTSEPKTTSDDKQVEVTGDGSNQLFEELRMDLADKRSELKTTLEEIIASEDATAEQKSEARDQMIALEETGQNEEMLETLIKSSGYKDVFVKADGDTVSIHVQSEELSKQQANKIIQLAEKELDASQVAVSYQAK